jgi:cysteine desulfurase family protein (TIGR01976 family)
VRARFPALEREENGIRIAYFDGPGGSQVPDTVIAAMAGYLCRSNANLGGAFPTSRESDAVFAAARAAAADMTGSLEDEIAFGPNMTTLNFLLGHAVARTLERDDEIVTTELDHDANVAPWLRIAEDHGLHVRQARLHPHDGSLDLDHLESLITPRTRIVAFTLASNALGTVPPVCEIVRAARRVGALTWADAVHYGPHRRIDRGELEIDVLLTSPYKWFGPHLGLAAIRRDLAVLWPADRVRPAAQTPPGHRFETGTQSHEALAGLVATVDYLAGLGAGMTTRDRLDSAFAAIRRHEERLMARFLDAVPGIPGLELYGQNDPEALAERVATFLFSCAGWKPRALAEALSEKGMAAWDGNFYALSAIRALGLDEDGGAVRAGFLHYTTEEEVDRLIAGLRQLAR